MASGKYNPRAPFLTQTPKDRKESQETSINENEKLISTEILRFVYSSKPSSPLPIEQEMHDFTAGQKNYRDAFALTIQRNFEQALILAKKALDERPTSANCNYLYALVLDQLGKRNEAYDYYLKAYLLAPDYEPFHTDFDRIAEKTGKPNSISAKITALFEAQENHEYIQKAL